LTFENDLASLCVNINPQQFEKTQRIAKERLGMKKLKRQKSSASIYFVLSLSFLFGLVTYLPHLEHSALANDSSWAAALPIYDDEPETAYFLQREFLNNCDDGHIYVEPVDLLTSFFTKAETEIKISNIKDNVRRLVMEIAYDPTILLVESLEAGKFTNKLSRYEDKEKGKIFINLEILDLDPAAGNRDKEYTLLKINWLAFSSGQSSIEIRHLKAFGGSKEEIKFCFPANGLIETDYWYLK
jgi:hypothetical protein